MRHASIWQTSIASRLEELLEDHAVLHVLARRDADRRDLATDARVAEHIVGARRLLDPPRVVRAQHAASRRSPRRRPTPGWRPSSGRRRGRARAGSVPRADRPREVGAHLHLHVREARGQRLAHERLDLVVVVAQPAGGRRVRRIPRGDDLTLARRLSAARVLQELDRLLGRRGHPRCSGSRRSRRAARASCPRGASRAASPRAWPTGPRPR